MSRTIEWQTGSAVPVLEAKRPAAGGSKWQDFVVKPEYKKLVKYWPEGRIDLRFLPPLPGGESSWITVREVLSPFGAGFRVIVREDGMIAKANWYLKKNRKDLLASKDNQNGFKLWGTPEAFAWGLWFDGDKPRLGIFSSSFSSASSSPMKQIVDQTVLLEPNPGGTPQPKYPSLVEASAGRYVSVTRAPKGTKAPALVSIGSQDAPLQPLLDKLSDEEFSLLKNLDQVFHETNEAEEIAILSRYIGNELTEEIRKA